jgi:hypothetical protein
MKRNNLQEAMARRSPLTPREAVEPVDLYPSPPGDKAVYQQVDKPTIGKGDMSSNEFVDKPISKQFEGLEGLRRRYTTYLRPDTIKAIKWLAVDGERNDYEIVQEALDEYLQRTRG